MSKKQCCITIDRQYGSGGREVGRILSQRLQIPCYGKELVLLTASDYGIKVEDLKKLDERRTGSLLHDLALFAFGFQNYDKMMEPFDIHKEVANTIRRLAKKGPCIFIGRCADAALEGKADFLNLFIYASSMEERVRRVRQLDHVEARDAETAIRKRDNQRRDYYNHFTGKGWGDMSNYDACLNTTAFGYEGCADLVLHMLDRD